MKISSDKWKYGFGSATNTDQAYLPVRHDPVVPFVTRGLKALILLSRGMKGCLTKVKRSTTIDIIHIDISGIVAVLVIC